MQTMTSALKSLIAQVKQGPVMGNSQSSSSQGSVKISEVRRAAEDAKDTLKLSYR